MLAFTFMSDSATELKKGTEIKIAERIIADEYPNAFLAQPFNQDYLVCSAISFTDLQVKISSKFREYTIL